MSYFEYDYKRQPLSSEFQRGPQEYRPDITGSRGEYRPEYLPGEYSSEFRGRHELPEQSRPQFRQEIGYENAGRTRPERRLAPEYSRTRETTFGEGHPSYGPEYKRTTDWENVKKGEWEMKKSGSKGMECDTHKKKGEWKSSTPEWKLEMERNPTCPECIAEKKKHILERGLPEWKLELELHPDCPECLLEKKKHMLAKGTECGHMIEKMKRTVDLPYYSGWWRPRADIMSLETGDIRVEFELPGVRRDHISVTVDNDTLVLQTTNPKTKKKETGFHYQHERHCGNFYRKLQLPAFIDATRVEMKFDEGVLKITGPKTDESTPRRTLYLKERKQGEYIQKEEHPGIGGHQTEPFHVEQH